MRNAVPLIIQGLSGVVVVAVKHLITPIRDYRGWSRRKIKDHWVWWSSGQRMNVPLILEPGPNTVPVWVIGKYSFWTVISKTKFASNRKRRVHVIKETPCFEPYGLNAPVLNLRRGTTNWLPENCLNGMLGYNQAIWRNWASFLLD